VAEQVIDTRRKAHYEAVKVLHRGIHHAVSTLNEHSLYDQKELTDPQRQARGILDAIQPLSFPLLLHFWIEVLREVTRCPKIFTTEGFATGGLCPRDKMKTVLINELDALVTACFDHILKICEVQEISIEERRARKKKSMFSEHAEDSDLSTTEEINRCMLEAVDRHRSTAESRFSRIS